MAKRVTYPPYRAHTFALAPRRARIAARVYDGLLMLLASGPGLLLIAGRVAPLGLYVAAAGAGLMLAYQWYLLLSTGQSVAKSWAGLVVVRRDGQPVDFYSAVVLRTLVPAVLSLIPGFLPVVFTLDLMLFSRRSRRCLRDLIADTVVVQGRLQ